MISWTTTGLSRTVGSAVYLTELRNWAAQLDEDCPVFFATSPWEDLVPADHVADLIEELETLLARANPEEGAPEDAATLLRSMLEVARAARNAHAGIEIE